MADPAGWGKRSDMVVHNPAPFNAEPPPAALAGDELTDLAAFYSRNHGDIPDISPNRWRLSVDGSVDNPLTLTYPELTTRFAAHDIVATLMCAGNRRAELLTVRPIVGKEPWAQAAISTARWRGARLGDVLAAAGVRADGRPDGRMYVAFTAADVAAGLSPDQVFGGSIPLAKATSAEVLLAWAMNDQPLPRIHGGPVRVVVPGFIGARSVKWISGVTVQPTPSQNYFQAVDYRMLPADGHQSPGAGIPLSSLALTCAILSPDDGATVPAGPLEVCGYAVAEDTRRIASVQVSPNDGTDWHAAHLEPSSSRWAWRFWSITLDAATTGPLKLTARAWDYTGATHPESPAALWNPAGYGNNSWARAELTVR